MSLNISLNILISKEQLMTPEQYAEVLCEDLDLPPLSFVPAISESIRKQLEAAPDTFDPPETLLAPHSDARVAIKV